ncbi:hypothetical protein ACFFRR_002867 [Megaselia abdita]
MLADWSLIPPKALRAVFSYFSIGELNQFKCVCKTWYEQIKYCEDDFDIDPDMEYGDIADLVDEEMKELEGEKNGDEELGEQMTDEKPENTEDVKNEEKAQVDEKSELPNEVWQTDEIKELVKKGEHFRNLAAQPGVTRERRQNLLRLNRQNKRRLIKLRRASKNNLARLEIISKGNLPIPEETVEDKKVDNEPRGEIFTLTKGGRWARHVTEKGRGYNWTISTLAMTIPKKEWCTKEVSDMMKKSTRYLDLSKSPGNTREQQKNFLKLRFLNNKKLLALKRKNKRDALVRLGLIKIVRPGDKVTQKEEAIKDTKPLIDVSKIKKEKVDEVVSAWSKLFPKALQNIESFLTLEDAKNLRLVCKQWNESLQQDICIDDFMNELEELEDHPLVELSDDERDAVDPEDLLVAVIFRCSSESVVSDKDWKTLEKDIRNWSKKFKDRKPPIYEALEEKYKEHRILRCFDSTSKKTLSEIMDYVNRMKRKTSFEVVKKAEIPRKGPYLTHFEIIQLLKKSKKNILLHKGDNVQKLGFDAFCRLAKAWEVIDRYEEKRRKRILYSEMGVKENPRKHPRKPVKKLRLTQKQLDKVAVLYPSTKQIISLVEDLNRKKHLSNTDYDTLKFGSEWLLYFKQKILDLEERKKYDKKSSSSSKTAEKKSSTKKDEKTTSSAKKDEKITSSSKDGEKVSSSTKKDDDKTTSSSKDGEKVTSSTKKDDEQTPSSTNEDDQNPSSTKKDDQNPSSTIKDDQNPSSTKSADKKSSEAENKLSSSKKDEPKSAAEKGKESSAKAASSSKGDKHSSDDKKSSDKKEISKRDDKKAERHSSSRHRTRASENTSARKAVSSTSRRDDTKSRRPVSSSSRRERSPRKKSESSTLRGREKPLKPVVPDWNRSLPGKFWRQLKRYLSDRDLVTISTVCKRWYTNVKPNLERKAREVMEARAWDRRLQRQIEDAKQTVITYINRDPADLTETQLERLQRSKMILERENIFDLDYFKSIGRKAAKRSVSPPRNVDSLRPHRSKIPRTSDGYRSDERQKSIDRLRDQNRRIDRSPLGRRHRSGDQDEREKIDRFDGASLGRRPPSFDRNGQNMLVDSGFDGDLHGRRQQSSDRLPNMPFGEDQLGRRPQSLDRFDRNDQNMGMNSGFEGRPQNIDRFDQNRQIERFDGVPLGVGQQSIERFDRNEQDMQMSRGFDGTSFGRNQQNINTFDRNERRFNEPLRDRDVQSFDRNDQLPMNAGFPDPHRGRGMQNDQNSGFGGLQNFNRFDGGEQNSRRPMEFNEQPNNNQGFDDSRGSFHSKNLSNFEVSQNPRDLDDSSNSSKGLNLAQNSYLVKAKKPIVPSLTTPSFQNFNNSRGFDNQNSFNSPNTSFENRRGEFDQPSNFGSNIPQISNFDNPPICPPPPSISNNDMSQRDDPKTFDPPQNFQNSNFNFDGTRNCQSISGSFQNNNFDRPMDSLNVQNTSFTNQNFNAPQNINNNRGFNPQFGSQNTNFVNNTQAQSGGLGHPNQFAEKRNFGNFGNSGDQSSSFWASGNLTGNFNFPKKKFGGVKKINKRRESFNR